MVSLTNCESCLYIDKECNLKVERATREKFCMCCKSKDNLQVSINLLTDPAFLCSKCILLPHGKK